MNAEGAANGALQTPAKESEDTVTEATLFAVLSTENGPRVVASVAAHKGMTSALGREGDQGRAAARQRVLYLASLREPFSIDEARRGELVNTVSPGTWGAIFSGLARQGRITCVGVTTSTRPESHGRLVRTWVGA